MEDSMSKKMFCSRQFNDVPGKSPAAGHMNSTASRILVSYEAGIHFVYFKVLYLHLPGGTNENHEELKSR